MADKLNTGEVIVRNATEEDMILVAEMTQVIQKQVVLFFTYDQFSFNNVWLLSSGVG